MPNYAHKGKVIPVFYILCLGSQMEIFSKATFDLKNRDKNNSVQRIHKTDLRNGSTWISHFGYYDLFILCSQDGVGKQGKALGTVERYLVGQGLIEVLPSLIQPR
jgi:hypothetical protein